MNVIEKTKAYLHRAGLPRIVQEELGLDGLSDESKAQLGRFLLRREREATLALGVHPEALKRWRALHRPLPAMKADGAEDAEADGDTVADGTIVIDGTIVSDELRESSSQDAGQISPSEVKAQYEQALASDPDSIRVVINSPGGDVFATEEMIDMLNDYEGPIDVRIRGIAASAAAYLAIRVSNDLSMSPGSLMMVHRSSVNGMNRDTLGYLENILEKIDGNMVDSMVFASTYERDQAVDAIEAETWYSAKEAYDIGLVTSEPEPPTRRSRNLNPPVQDAHVPASNPNPSAPQRKAIHRARGLMLIQP